MEHCYYSLYSFIYLFIFGDGNLNFLSPYVISINSLQVRWGRNCFLVGKQIDVWTVIETELSI